MSDWPVRPLGEICEIVGGGTPSRKIGSYFEGDIPWLTVKDLKSHNLTDAQEHITAQAVEKSATRILPENTVVVATRISVGATGITRKRMAINQDLKGLLLQQELIPEYVAWLVSTRSSLLHHKATGSTVKGISTRVLADLPIPLPPLDEQRRIVRLLDRAAEIRRRADAARTKARALIPALFTDMFGDPATNPMGWRRDSLGNHTLLVGGGTPSKTNPEFWDGNIPWVSPKDMKAPIIADSQDKITETALMSSPVRLIPPDNILIVVRGMILAHTVPIRMNSVAVTLNQDMKALLPTDRLNATFLRWMLQVAHSHLLGQVRESAHGTRKLETPALRAFPTMLPSLDLQTTFAEKICRIEALASNLDTAAAKAEALAASLSAEVFGQ